MNEIILYHQKNNGIKVFYSNWIEFQGAFNVNQELINTSEEWEQFLAGEHLPADYIPNYCSSGFCADTFDELCRLGYIENTEFNYFDCYAYDGKIFASPTTTNLQSGQHYSRAWGLFVEYFEQANDCKLFFK
jgi:hypothetical protein